MKMNGGTEKYMRRYQYPDTVTLELSGFEAEHLECLLYNRANDVMEPPHDVTRRLYYRLRAMKEDRWRK